MKMLFGVTVLLYFIPYGFEGFPQKFKLQISTSFSILNISFIIIFYIFTTHFSWKDPKVQCFFEKTQEKKKAKSNYLPTSHQCTQQYAQISLLQKSVQMLLVSNTQEMTTTDH